MQGSGLSPALFLLVMDPLLRELQASGVGLSLKGYYDGDFLHADDVRTLATSEDSLRKQIDMVKSLLTQNLLMCQNVKLCDFQRASSVAELPACEVYGAVMPAGDAGKCLGYW